MIHPQISGNPIFVFHSCSPSSTCTHLTSLVAEGRSSRVADFHRILVRTAGLVADHAAVRNHHRHHHNLPAAVEGDIDSTLRTAGVGLVSHSQNGRLADGHRRIGCVGRLGETSHNLPRKAGYCVAVGDHRVVVGHMERAVQESCCRSRHAVAAGRMIESVGQEADRTMGVVHRYKSAVRHCESNRSLEVCCSGV